MKIIFRKKSIIIILLIFFLFVRYITSMYKYEYKYQDFNKQNAILKIIKVVEIKNNNNLYEVEYLKDKFILNSKCNTLYRYGDILKADIVYYNFKEANKKEEFDYIKYLNSILCIGSIYAKSDIKYISKEKDLYYYIYDFKYNLSIKIDKSLDKYSSLFKSLIYGEKSGEYEEELFRKIGISHLLSVSGGNVLLIVMIILFLFKKTDKFKYFIVIITTILFCIFCNFEISITRASIMIIITYFLKLFDIEVKSIYIFILSLYIMIIYNPYYIYSASFILSFFSVSGIILFFPRLDSFIKYIFKFLKLKEINYITNAIAIYFSILIAIFPIQVHYFKSYNFLSIITNVIITGVVSIFNLIGIMFCTVIDIPYVSVILKYILIYFMKILFWFMEFLANFEMSIVFLPLNYLIFILYYLFVFYIFYKDSTLFRNKLFKYKKIINIVIILTLLLSVIYCIYNVFFNKI